MKNKITVIICCFTLFASGQDHPQYDSLWNRISNDKTEVYFTFQLTSSRFLKALSKTVSIDKVIDGKVYAYASRDSFMDFMSFDIQYNILPHPGTTNPNPLTLSYEEIDFKNNTWDFYPDYDAYVSMMQQFAGDYPEICEYFDLGTLSSGRKILAVKISDDVTVNEQEPEFLYTASMHGDEVVSYVLMLRLIDYLLSNYGTNERITSIINNMEIWINPLANPDGTYVNGNDTILNPNRFNANGVDPNRNFPDPEDGPHPDGNAWQTETVIFMDLATQQHFTLSCNLHGGAELCNYPWDTWSTKPADETWWIMVCREYADTAQYFSPPGYMTDENNGVTNGYEWYTISGGRQDYMNYFHQCREFTLELSHTKFPDANLLPSYWEYNYRSLLGYMEQGLYGLRGMVSDNSTGEPLFAEVYIENHDIDSSWVFSDSTGKYFRLLYEGTYDVTFSSKGYHPKTIYDVSVINYDTTILNVKLVKGELIADFEASKSCVALNQSVSFTDNSFGLPDTWQWYFEGGNPSSSAEANPSNIRYSEPGEYNVSLKVSNNEYSDSIVKKDYIFAAENFSMQNDTICTCFALFTDPGGNEGNYGNEQDFVMTFVPDEPGNSIKIIFTAFELEYHHNCEFDWLKIFDGSSTDAPLIGRFCGSDSPEIVLADNTSGSLTFAFHSDSYQTKSGWVAMVKCESNTYLAEESPNDKLFVLYPNPAKSGFFVIENKSENSLLEMYDIRGERVHRKKIFQSENRIDISDLKSGIYLVRLCGNSGTETRKILIY